MKSTLLAIVTAAALGASALPTSAATPAVVALKSPSGLDAGTATLTQGPKGVVIHIVARGLTPGWHAVHLHEVGDCSAPDFQTAGGHVHGMTTHIHGLLNPNGDEAGDLPNLFVGADGSGAAEFFSGAVSLDGADGKPALLDKDGSALVVHANQDDFVTQPIGGAGARIACGVIR